MEWQPIETSPKDGTKILLYGKYGWMIYEKSKVTKTGILVGYFDDEQWVTVTDNPYEDIMHPTHWMPLPPPPKE